MSAPQTACVAAAVRPSPPPCPSWCAEDHTVGVSFELAVNGDLCHYQANQSITADTGEAWLQIGRYDELPAPAPDNVGDPEIILTTRVDLLDNPNEATLFLQPNEARALGRQLLALADLADTSQPRGSR